jgi:hypothetical protein
MADTPPKVLSSPRLERARGEPTVCSWNRLKTRITETPDIRIQSKRSQGREMPGLPEKSFKQRNRLPRTLKTEYENETGAYIKNNCLRIMET